MIRVLGIGGWGLVPAVAAPTQVGVETHTRGLVIGGGGNDCKKCYRL